MDLSNQNIELPQLSTYYHKSRQQMVLFSGLLLAWEIIGIEFKEVPFGNFKITLKTPDLAPYILIGAILYFTARTILEWFQCQYARRQTIPARLDLSLSLVITSLSLSFYTVQRLQTSQILKDLSGFDISVFLLSLALSFSLLLSLLNSRRWLIALLPALTGLCAINFLLGPVIRNPFLYLSIPVGIVGALGWGKWANMLGLIKVVYGTLYKTYRLHAAEAKPLLDEVAKSRRSCVICLWHGLSFVCVPFIIFSFRKLNVPVYIPVSSSKDGRLLKKLFKSIGAHPYFYKKLSEKKRIVRLFKNQKIVLVSVPDGPIGPRFHFKFDGILRLALKYNSHLLAIRFKAQSFWRFNSWDAFILPKPFSSVSMDIQDIKPIGDIDDDTITRLKKRIILAMSQSHDQNKQKS